MQEPQKRARRAKQSEPGARIRDTAIVLMTALVVRAVYLFQSRSNPSFTLPLVDSETYDALARRLVDHGQLDPGLFWQGFLYPLFLSGIYALTDGSVVAARIVQALLGCLTCWLVYLFGNRAFGRREGVIAGLITALYGPLVFYETELVAAGLAAFWLALLLWLFHRALTPGRRVDLFLLGLCGALAVVTRPTFLAPFAVAGCWIAIRTIRADRARWHRVLFIAGGFLIVALPIGLLNRSVSGHFGILPYSGGINLYVGNNPEFARTIMIRPGWEWNQLTALPGQHGVPNDRWQNERWFMDQVSRFVADQPVTFLKGLATKTVQFLSSREIPRNEDIYVHRSWSSLLGLLVWKVAGIGFPFALVLPLGFIGAVTRRCTIPLYMWPLLVLQAASIIVVFVSSRYRVEMAPLFAVLAAAGAVSLVQVIRTGPLGHKLTWAAIMVVLPVFSGIVGPFVEERFDYTAEFHLHLGRRLGRDNRLPEAAQHFEQAIKLRPTYAEAHSNYCGLLVEVRRLDEARQHCELAMKHRPDASDPLINMGNVLQAKNQLPSALALYQRAAALAPNDAAPAFNAGLVLGKQRRWSESIEQLRRVLGIDPGYDRARLFLLAALLQSGDVDTAVQESIHLVERFSEQSSRDPTLLVQAAGLLIRHPDPRLHDPDLLFKLARALQAVGKEEMAAETTELARAAALERKREPGTDRQRAVPLR